MERKISARALAALVDYPDQFMTARQVEPTVHRPPEDAARRLLDWAACDVLLADHALRHPAMEMARDGRRISSERYTMRLPHVRQDVSDQVESQAVSRELCDGASLIFSGLHRGWRPVVDFCRRLGHELGAPVNANAYLTPAGEQGFVHHHDTHDSFLIQTEGSKTWQLYEPYVPHPLSGYHEWSGLPLSAQQRKALLVNEPARTVTLKPGDVLWLPRGWIHNGFTEDEPSLHVTIGIVDVTCHWVLRQVVDALAQVDEFRMDTEAGSLRTRDGARRAVAEVAGRLRRWAEQDDAVDAVDLVLGRHWARFQPARVRPVARLLGADVPDPLRVCGESVCAVERTASGQVRLLLGGTDITLADDAARVVVDLLGRDGECVPRDDILAALPGESGRSLVLQLVDSGVLVAGEEGVDWWH